MKEELLSKLNETFKKVAGTESYGNVTEMYDEDGVVIATAEDMEDEVEFKFMDDPTNEDGDVPAYRLSKIQKN